MRRITTVSVAFWTLLVSVSFAQQPANTTLPNLIRYSGVLKDGQDVAMSSAKMGVTFAIYSQQDGGAPIWMETQNVTTDASGGYSALLGSTTANGLPDALFSQQEQRWLGVQVQGQAEQPRVLMVSVPYAFKAHEAETLGGKSVSDFVLAKGANSSANGNTTAPAGSSSSNTAPANSGVRKGAASAGPTNFSGSTIDQIVGVTQSNTGMGINASAPTLGIKGTATAPSGTAYGVQGVASGTAGVGLIGTATSTTGSTYGLRGTSSSRSGTGVRGIVTATSGSTTGISGYVASAAGVAGAFNNAAGGKILSGQNNGTETFFVDGSGSVVSANTVQGNVLNSWTGFQIGGVIVLAIGGQNDDNLFAGNGAGRSNVTGSGRDNVFLGTGAGSSNTIGGENVIVGAGAGIYNVGGVDNTIVGSEAGYYQDASYNTFLGAGSGLDTTSGAFNTFVGAAAGLSNTTGNNNTIIGYDAQRYTGTTSSNNTFLGYEAGYNNTNGDNVFIGSETGLNNAGTANVFVGTSAGQGNSGGNYNVFLGDHAGWQNTTGYGNIFVGTSAGMRNLYGAGNVYISNEGPSMGESNTIRIGDVQSQAYIAGIYGQTSSSGVAMYINSDGRLGTVVSSQRFKEQVEDMGDSTKALMKLRPVTFFYKPGYTDGERTLQYGLIAEEVAKVYPELVAYDKEGLPYSVRYQYLSTMLLNEVQKQHHRAEAEAKVITTQQTEIQALQEQNREFQERLSRLEKLVPQTVAQK